MMPSPIARVSPLAAEDPRSQDPLLDDLVRFVGYRPNALLTMARKPGLLAAVLALVEVTVRGAGQLDLRLRLLIATETCRGARCVYSATHAVHAAHEAGVSWERLSALPHYPTSSLFGPEERAALAIATVGSTLPIGDAGPAFIEAKHHFADEALVEIVSIVSTFGWFNRWNSLMRSEMESAPSTCRLEVSWLRDLSSETST